MTPCVLVGITTYKTYGAINHLTIALCNLTFIYQVVTQGGSHLGACKMTADQPEAGGHVRFADEKPSASIQNVVHTEEERCSYCTLGLLLLILM
jgi:hypothetical protein